VLAGWNSISVAYLTFWCRYIIFFRVLCCWAGDDDPMRWNFLSRLTSGGHCRISRQLWLVMVSIERPMCAPIADVTCTQFFQAQIIRDRRKKRGDLSW
jgi:hypothetical protein